jgi:hypothetical protein
MPWASTEENGGFIQPFAVGPVMQALPIPQVATPGTIAASGTYDAGLMPSDGYKVLAIGATLSNAGTISVQRYIDVDGTVPQGAAVTVALTAGIPGILNINDGLPFAAFDVKIINGAATVANVTNFAMLLNAS